MMLSQRHPVVRSGFSLLEVLVAMTIFLFALVAIGGLIALGGDRALEIQYRSQAAQICQSKLAEVVAGSIPLSSQGDSPLDEDPDWTWSLDAQQGSVTGLWNVKVTASRPRPDGSKIEASLQQMVMDPSLRGSTLDAAAAAAAAAASTSTDPNAGSTDSGSGATTTPQSMSSAIAPGMAAPAAASTSRSSAAPAAASGGTTNRASSTPTTTSGMSPSNNRGSTPTSGASRGGTSSGGR
jgi:prepilin-type N-terminal cleavage/methylation domain-containing protein